MGDAPLIESTSGLVDLLVNPEVPDVLNGKFKGAIDVPFKRQSLEETSTQVLFIFAVRSSFGVGEDGEMATELLETVVVKVTVMLSLSATVHGGNGFACNVKVTGAKAKLSVGPGL